MSLWTDRELKTLIARVNDLEKRIEVFEIAANQPARFGSPTPPVDKRTKEYKEWKNAS